MSVFFDLDGTLLVDDYDNLGQVAQSWLYETYNRDLCVSKTEFHFRFSSFGQKHFDKYIQGAETYMEYGRGQIHDLFWSVSRSLSEEEADDIWIGFRKRFLGGLRLYPDSAPCLDALGARVKGLITNAMIPEETKDKLKKVGLESTFQTILISQEVGIRKPDPRIFHLACKAAGVDPNDSYYIGDNIATDIEGCRMAGMKGILIDRSNDPRPQDDVTIIRNLAELPRLLATHSH